MTRQNPANATDLTNPNRYDYLKAKTDSEKLTLSDALIADYADGEGHIDTEDLIEEFMAMWGDCDECREWLEEWAMIDFAEWNVELVQGCYTVWKK